MAYVYLDDNGPESEDYDSNYFYFDESNAAALNQIENLLTSRAPRDEAFREQLSEICQASFSKPVVKKVPSIGKEGWYKIISKYIRNMSFNARPRFAQT